MLVDVTIQLTQGKETTIDADRLNIVEVYKWCYRKCVNTGYAIAGTRVNGRPATCYMHRLIWESVHGPIPAGMSIDHINGDGCDNRIANLRLADQHLQKINSQKRRQGMLTSTLYGVRRDKRREKWLSSIRLNGKYYHLGSFVDEVEAHNAYKLALEAYCVDGTLPLPIRVTSSRYKGVHWNKNARKWESGVKLEGTEYYLGCFNLESEAHEVYVKAINEYNTYGTLPQGKETTSKHKGVSWNKKSGKWHACITIDKIYYYLGCFTDEMEASNAYWYALEMYKTKGIVPNRKRKRRARELENIKDEKAV